uniref:Snake toxin/toxin-like domain-containing protein n=1 Tax=Otus sunia TaxID=257818 RepID=A0A8C8AI47_9STRI
DSSSLPVLPASRLLYLYSYPFMCYVCQEQESNKNCLTISMCAKEDKYCVTFRNSVGTSMFLNNTLFVL